MTKPLIEILDEIFHTAHTRKPFDAAVQEELKKIASGELSAYDTVNHPQHYGKVPNIECIDVVEHFNFNRGNAIKYIWRAGLKGDEIEDLRKAMFYLKREISNLEKEKTAE